MNEIRMKVEKPSEMRYKTIGDWYENDNTKETMVEVADLGDDKMNFLILVHEVIEAKLCENAGITQDQVDEYDTEHEDDDDPGLNIEAPYHQQHMVAYSIEVLLAGILGVNWKEYTDKIDEVFDVVSEAIDKREDDGTTE